MTPPTDYNPDRAPDRELHPYVRDLIDGTVLPPPTVHPAFQRILDDLFHRPRPSGDATGPHASALDTEFDADPHAGACDDCAVEGLYPRFDADPESPFPTEPTP